MEHLRRYFAPGVFLLFLTVLLLPGTSVLAGKPLTAEECRGCHGTETPMRHMYFTVSGAYTCNDCHGLIAERDCTVCHHKQDCIGLVGTKQRGGGGKGKKK